jgi:hypothetical protein
MRLKLFILCIAFSNITFGQGFFVPKDSVYKKRMLWVASTELGLAGGSSIGTWNLWYKTQELTKLHSFDDSKEWGGMDKLGHAYTANKITGLSVKLARWSGLKPMKARLYGFGVAMAYQTSLELMDGFSVGWGFSWTDMLANTSGSAIYVAQDWAWKEQRVLLKFSYAPTKYAAFRPNTLGSTFGERLFKDYNGQTHWISGNISSFMSISSKFPKWINVAVGHSMDQKLYGNGTQSTFTKDGQVYNFTAQHQWYLSLDIDFTRIQTSRKWLKTLFNALNLVKVPFPALVLQGGKLGFSPTSY